MRDSPASASERRLMAPGLPCEVVVAGCIGIDTNVYLQGEDIDWTVEANFTRNLDSVGQAGGCSARAFKRLGRRTAFMGAVGDDAHGAWVRRALEGEGIEALFLVDPLGTHRSVNLVFPDGRRKNFYDGRGQMSVEPDLDVCRAWLRGARLLHAQLENWCRHLLSVARELGVLVSVDLQDVVTLDDPYRREFLDLADVVFFSTVNFPEPRAVVEGWLRDRPHRVVVGGMGARGAILGVEGAVEHFAPLDHPGLAPVVDTNGAGDALAAGFLCAWAFEGCRPVDALRRAQASARIACTQRADQKVFATREEVEGVLRLCS